MTSTPRHPGAISDVILSIDREIAALRTARDLLLEGDVMTETKKPARSRRSETPHLDPGSSKSPADK